MNPDLRVLLTAYDAWVVASDAKLKPRSSSSKNSWIPFTLNFKRIRKLPEAAAISYGNASSISTGRC